ncbi:8-amino-7-oxononanoate synthase [Paenibacillus sp. CECT 9249]|uniref:8-amino-7-oxononanoate synthase n=1 Tax=Paenibacillus sp. CECT 9249 TaxID=2845385 RepID=UPI001E3E4DCE|nr:8-amino-7-oxononanoate synthase [Paenibacillus sp. CECT 9249]CAH0118845.1 8-amino-7-oxononanoate synthase [Paenibacillus sp. CECT 9249]
MEGTDRWQWMRDELRQLSERNQYRRLEPTGWLEGGWIERSGRRMLNLASNHYLGLSNPLPNGTDGAEEGDAGMRLGAGASRLITGNDPVYDRFEREFAAYKGTESSLVFSSGYMANVGVISALAGRGDYVFSDRLNHASIVDGIALSRAKCSRYRHRDIGQLERMLRSVPAGAKKLIVTDAVFSMDGTTAPLPELVELKERYGAILMVDEAHSGGVYGEEGQGLAHALGLQRRVDVQMGTFSKAYGACGAYVAGDAVLIQYLINKARTLIYNTALPPIVMSAVRANWLTIRSEPWRREALFQRAAWFRRALNECGFDTGDSESHIIPLLLGDNARAVDFGAALQAEGIAAVAIRPPTVPEGAARIRFTVMATHRLQDLQWAVERIAAVGRRMGIVP